MTFLVLASPQRRLSAALYSPLRVGTLGNVVPSGNTGLKQPQGAGGALGELQKGQKKQRSSLERGCKRPSVEVTTTNTVCLAPVTL